MIAYHNSPTLPQIATAWVRVPSHKISSLIMWEWSKALIYFVREFVFTSSEPKNVCQHRGIFSIYHEPSPPHVITYISPMSLGLGFPTRSSAPSVSGNFISPVTSCLVLQEEKQQTGHPMSFTWASHIAASVLTRRQTLPNQTTPQSGGNGTILVEIYQIFMKHDSF